jgi:hypothetical protein
MRKSSIVGMLAGLMFTGSVALAEEPPKNSGEMKKNTEAGAATSIPQPQKPGAETRALLPLAIDATWKGKMPANALQEGSPEMTTSGNQDCKWSVDNLWLTCDVKSTMGEGKMAMKWRGHVMLGYDFMAKEYRATVVDNMGVANMMTGNIEGNKLTLTSVMETNVGGKRCKGRMTWDWTNPNAITMTTENSKDGGEYKVVEQATLKPTKKERLPPAA